MDRGVLLMKNVIKIVSLSQLSSVADTIKTAIILLLINTYLEAKEIAFWLLLLAILAVLRVFENGTLPNWSRLVTFQGSGQGKINNDFYIQMSHLKKISTGELNYQMYKFYGDLTKYLVLTIVLIIITILFNDGLNLSSEFIATLAFLFLGFVTSIRLTYLNAFYSGTGRNHIIFQYKIIGSLVNIVIACIGLIFFHSLFSLSLGYFANVLFSKIPLLYSNVVRLTPIANKNTFKLVLGNSVKLVLVNISAIIIVRLPQFYGVAFDGLVGSSSISWAITLCSLVVSFLSMSVSSVLPNLNGLIAKGNYRGFFKAGQLIHLSIFILASAMLVTILFFGNMLAPLGFPKIDFASTWIPCLLFVLFLLELHHSISALLLTCFDEVPFLKATLFSLFLMIVLNLLFVSDKIISVLIIQMVVQLGFNNWYWHYRLYKKSSMTRPF